MDLLIGLAREQGTTVVLVTHDARVAAYADREVMVRDGKVTARAWPPANAGGALMFRLGLRLTLHSGREALHPADRDHGGGRDRAWPCCSAVLADFHAFQANSNRPCWECTQGAALPAARFRLGGELWNYSADYYQGQTIERLDLAALGPGRAGPAGHLPAARPRAVRRLAGAGRAAAHACRATSWATASRARWPGPIGAPGAVRAGRAGDLRRLPAVGAGRGARHQRRHARSPPRPGPGGLHPVLPVRVRRRRARGAVPRPHPDRHRDPAGRGPPRGALRRAPAGRGHAAGQSASSPRSTRW